MQQRDHWSRQTSIVLYDSSNHGSCATMTIGLRFSTSCHGIAEGDAATEIEEGDWFGRRWHCAKPCRYRTSMYRFCNVSRSAALVARSTAWHVRDKCLNSYLRQAGYVMPAVYHYSACLSVCLWVCLHVCLLETASTNYWSDLIFVKILRGQGGTDFWNWSVSGSGSIILKDSSALWDMAFFHISHLHSPCFWKN